MKTLKSIFRFYIDSSIHVALAICALVQITFIKFGVTKEYAFLLFTFLGSVAAYNFVKYSKASKLYHRKLNTSKKGIRLLTILCSLFVIYFAFQLSYDTLMYMAPFIVLTVLYAVPVFPNDRNLRSIAGVKIFVIGLVWCGVTVLVPVVYVKGNLNLDFFIELVQRFLFVIVIMLPFEIRDLKYDALVLETVPQKIGVTKTKVFGSILLVAFLLLTAMKDKLSPVEVFSTILITIITLFFLWGAERKQYEYYCSFWVESVPLMWLAIFLVLQNLFA